MEKLVQKAPHRGKKRANEDMEAIKTEIELVKINI